MQLPTARRAGPTCSHGREQLGHLRQLSPVQLEIDAVRVIRRQCRYPPPRTRSVAGDSALPAGLSVLDTPCSSRRSRAVPWRNDRPAPGPSSQSDTPSLQRTSCPCLRRPTPRRKQPAAGRIPGVPFLECGIACRASSMQRTARYCRSPSADASPQGRDAARTRRRASGRGRICSMRSVATSTAVRQSGLEHRFEAGLLAGEGQPVP
jgi:hypothetical protein